MTYKEFVNKVEEVLQVKAPEKPKNQPKGGYYYDRNSLYFSTYCCLTWKEDDLVLFSKYETGGMAGGNCWGDEAEPYTADKFREFIELEEILRGLCPHISFLEFRSLKGEVETCGYTEGEYYGNSTEYRVEYIGLKKLYNWLVSHNLIGQ